MPEKCFVNNIFGGGVFICRRPVVTPNGFCAYHAELPLGQGLELTWMEWFKVWFIRKPSNLWRAIMCAPSRLVYWYRLRKVPKCAIKTCSDKALCGTLCPDHYYVL